MQTLFDVELFWGPGIEDGTYYSRVWADNRDEAIRLVAAEMADHPLDGQSFDTPADRELFLTEASNSVAYLAPTEDAVLEMLKALLKLPDTAELDPQKVQALLQANLPNLMR